MRCVSCGTRAGVIGHHVSYDPERRVPVCGPCHTSIHSQHNDHELAPDYLPLSKTRTKTGIKIQIDGRTLARLERMVLEEGINDINHALETLCERHATGAERRAAEGLYWSMSDYEVRDLSRDTALHAPEY